MQEKVFGVVYVKLGDIATITRGGNFQKKDFVKQGFPCIHYGQIYTSFGIYTDRTIKNISEDIAKKSKKAVKNDIIMAITSENIEDVCKCVAWLGDDKIAVSGHTAIIHHNENPKFLSYYFHTEDFYKQKKKLAHGTKVIEVTPDKLKDIIIPLPNIEKQNNIVAILDKFNTLCNDISDGLPAEIFKRVKENVLKHETIDSFLNERLRMQKINYRKSIKDLSVKGIIENETMEFAYKRLIFLEKEEIEIDELRNYLQKYIKNYTPSCLKNNSELKRLIRIYDLIKYKQ